jgi:GNAT superfamily N-acetyltransferase
VNISKSAEGVSIQEPRESEFAAFRVLLPRTSATPAGRAFRLAFDASGAHIVGALSYLDDSEAVTAAEVYVVPEQRRKGIGTLLVDYLSTEARRLGRDRVELDVDLISEPGAEAFLTSRGFRIIGRLNSVRSATAPYYAKYESFLEKSASLNELPPSARIVKLSEAPPQQIFELYQDYILGMPRMPGILRSFDPSQFPHAIALIIDDKVAGFLLLEPVGRLMRASAVVIAPEYRSRRIATMLFAIVHERWRGEIDEIEFDYLDAATFTAKRVSELGMPVSRSLARFQRAIGRSQEV